MTEGNFVDYVKLHLKSAKGGQGSAHMRREKYIEKGGPDGGDGGRVVMLLLKEIKTFGHYTTLSLKDTLVLAMENMVENKKCLAQMVRINI